MIDKQQERQRIGQCIADLRKRRGMTQTELAARVGLQAPHIARIEKGRYSVGLDTLAAIADGLGCRVEIIESNNP